MRVRMGPDTGEVDEALSDEAILRAAIGGDLDPTEALQTVASRGGLPVESTTGSFLFACVCGDGDWSLAGDFDDWAGQPMARMGALSWVEVTVADPYESAYKFTDGSIWMADPAARRYAYDEYGEKEPGTSIGAPPRTRLRGGGSWPRCAIASHFRAARWLFHAHGGGPRRSEPF